MVTPQPFTLQLRKLRLKEPRTCPRSHGVVELHPPPVQGGGRETPDWEPSSPSPCQRLPAKPDSWPAKCTRQEGVSPKDLTAGNLQEPLHMINTQEMLASITGSSQPPPLSERTTQGPTLPRDKQHRSAVAHHLRSPSPSQPLPLEPGSSFPPSHAPPSQAAGAAALCSRVRTGRAPGMLASCRGSCLPQPGPAGSWLLSRLPGKSFPLYPTPLNPCRLPQFLPWAGV